MRRVGVTGTTDLDGPDRPRTSTSSVARDAGSDHVPARVYLVVTALALLVGAIAVVRAAGTLASAADSDLAAFFLKSAAYVARGDPFHMYAVRAAAPYATYPNVDPPLGIVLMAALLRLARALGLARGYSAQVTFVSLPFVPLVPLLGALAHHAARGAHPADAAPAVPRFLAFALIALSPLSWLCVATWGHLEQPLMLCFLVAAVGALQRRRVGLAGVLAGLATLSGTAALFPLAALAALLLAGRQWRGAALLGGGAGAVLALGVAPFLVTDRRDVVYSFLTWRGSEQIGGNSIWDIFTVDAIAHAMPHTLAAAVRRLDTPAMLALAVVVGVLAARRLRVSAYEPEVWAVLAIAALGLPLLAKVMWPYYYFQPFVLLVIYELGTLRHRRGLWRWPVLTVGFLVVATTLAQYVGLRSAGALDRVAVGVLEFGAMLTVALATWRHLHGQVVQSGRPGAREA